MADGVSGRLGVPAVADPLVRAHPSLGELHHLVGDGPLFLAGAIAPVPLVRDDVRFGLLGHTVSNLALIKLRGNALRKATLWPEALQLSLTRLPGVRV